MSSRARAVAEKTNRQGTAELEARLVGPRLPVQVVLDTLICDADGWIVADTASGDWSLVSRAVVNGRRVGAVTAADNARLLAELINRGAHAIGLPMKRRLKLSVDER